MGKEQIQPQLDEAQRALVVALEEACAADLSNLDTRELIEIEETLEVASKAAKEAVSMRLKLESQSQRAGKQPGAPDANGPTDASGGIPHRVFDDSSGKRWHAFAVQPSSTTGSNIGLPVTFKNGWLVFDSVDEARRIAPIPKEWVTLPIEQLRLLCQQAVSAPKRAVS